MITAPESSFSPEIQSRIALIRSNLTAQLSAIDEFYDVQNKFIDEQFELDRRALDQAFQSEKNAIIKGALDELKEQREALQHQFNNVSLTFQGDVLDVQRTRSHNLRKRQRNPSNLPTTSNTRNSTSIGGTSSTKPNSRISNATGNARNLTGSASYNIDSHNDAAIQSSKLAVDSTVNDNNDALMPAVGGLAVSLLTNEELSTSQKQRQFYFGGLPLCGSERQLPMQMVTTANANVTPFNAPFSSPKSAGVSEYHFDLQCSGAIHPGPQCSVVDEPLEFMNTTVTIPVNPSHLNTMLSLSDIQRDIECLKPQGTSGRVTDNTVRSNSSIERVWVDSDRLYCGQQCFTRGDEIFLCQKDANRISATISAISPRDLTYRRQSDRACVKVPLQHFRTGRYTIKPRRERNVNLKKP